MDRRTQPPGRAPGLSPRLRRRYYTAIMADVVGPDGRVTASEIDAELAARAQANLAAHSNVSVHAGNAADFDPGECDAILINAGVTHPHPKWLASLRPSGSLMLPLTVTAGMGMGANLGKGVFAEITREPDGFSARVVSFLASTPVPASATRSSSRYWGRRWHQQPCSSCDVCAATLTIE